MKVSVITLGCKVNQYESQAMLDQLVRAGFSACESAAESDIVLINSCTVTSTSDHKVRQTLHRARRGNPSAVIVLTGIGICHSAECIQPDVGQPSVGSPVFLVYELCSAIHRHCSV